METVSNLSYDIHSYIILLKVKILILGCGWVGEEFAQQMASQGAELWLTTTSSDKAMRLEQLGDQVQVVDFDRDPEPWTLPTSFDYVLTSVPATSKHSAELLSNRFARVRDLLQKLRYRKHIFLSSVGIYPDRDGLFDEECTEGLNERLYDAERALQDLPDTIIYRLGGLFGKNRVFAKYFANKICTTGGQPANFVHLDDVVVLLELGFERLAEAGIYNIVCPGHPSKEEVVRASAQKYGYDLPFVFEPNNSFQKIVLSKKLIDQLGYQFQFSSPLEF